VEQERHYLGLQSLNESGEIHHPHAAHPLGQGRHGRARAAPHTARCLLRLPLPDDVPLQELRHLLQQLGRHRQVSGVERQNRRQDLLGDMNPARISELEPPPPSYPPPHSLQLFFFFFFHFVLQGKG
jgi:hypothetical protein